MKFTSILLIASTLLLTTSCNSTFYQVYQVNTNNDLVTSENNIIFEDSICKVKYNLWSDGGDIGFEFYNKTENELQIHLDKSYFILNGIAYDYYKNRIYAKSTSTGTSLTRSKSSSTSLTGINYSNLIQSN